MVQKFNIGQNVHAQILIFFYLLMLTLNNNATQTFYLNKACLPIIPAKREK